MHEKTNRNSNSFRESDRTERSLCRRNQVQTCHLSMMMVLREGVGKSWPGGSPLSIVAKVSAKMRHFRRFCAVALEIGLTGWGNLRMAESKWHFGLARPPG